MLRSGKGEEVSVGGLIEVDGSGNERDYLRWVRCPDQT